MRFGASLLETAVAGGGMTLSSSALLDKIPPSNPAPLPALLEAVRLLKDGGDDAFCRMPTGGDCDKWSGGEEPICVGVEGDSGSKSVTICLGAGDDMAAASGARSLGVRLAKANGRKVDGTRLGSYSPVRSIPGACRSERSRGRVSREGQARVHEFAQLDTIVASQAVQEPRNAPNCLLLQSLPQKRNPTLNVHLKCPFALSHPVTQPLAEPASRSNPECPFSPAQKPTCTTKHHAKVSIQNEEKSTMKGEGRVVGQTDLGDASSARLRRTPSTSWPC